MKFLNETDYALSKILVKFLFISMFLVPFANNRLIRTILLIHLACMLLFSIIVIAKYVHHLVNTKKRNK